ncbi:3349_t:CDS:2, partial [Acaulospora colombiana]
PVPDPSLPDKAVSSRSSSLKAVLPPSFYTTATVAPIRRAIHSSSPSVEDISFPTNGASLERTSSPENPSTKGIQIATSKIKGVGSMPKPDPGKEKSNQPKRKTGVDSIVPMSPAAMEKAAALLQRHREAVVENAIQRNKRRRKKAVVEQKSTIETGQEPVEEQSSLEPNDSTVVKKDKKKRKADVILGQNTEKDTSISNEKSNRSESPMHQKVGERSKTEAEGSGTSKHASSGAASLSLRRKLPAIRPEHDTSLDLVPKADNKIKGREQNHPVPSAMALTTSGP